MNVACFSPDGTRMASVSEDGWAKALDPAELHVGASVWQVNAEANDSGVWEMTLDRLF
ncbi:hypothetical protein [Gemmata obscuriglobus]|uniref:hypothetical protein n=1 Tax=Gemmata obscuriglobus TaxID=114 RepID=UPI0002EFFF5E|nr:hypothetical protein [Gemmata obscuriglobus]